MSKPPTKLYRCVVNGCSGFSLAEMMIAMLVLLVVLTAIFGIVSNVQLRYQQQLGSTQAQADMRRVLEFIARDLALAGANDLGGVVAGSSATVVQVQADLGRSPYDEYAGPDPTADGALSLPNEDIKYSFDASKGEITRYDAYDADYHIGGTLTGAQLPQIVAKQIKSLNIEYLDELEQLLPAPLSATNAVKVCKIRLTITAIYGRRRPSLASEDLTYNIQTEVLVQNNPANIGRF
ncbi:MAG: prepilin-type N-terminal cleavage/methylation domain-containing protein [Acidobacteriota bacterium]